MTPAENALCAFVALTLGLVGIVVLGSWFGVWQ